MRIERARHAEYARSVQHVHRNLTERCQKRRAELGACLLVDTTEESRLDGLRLHSSIRGDREVQTDSYRKQPEWVREQVSEERNWGFTDSRRDENPNNNEKCDEPASDNCRLSES